MTMANWKEVTERWLPIVEKMEEHHMDDYAIPEIYRAAEKAIGDLIDAAEYAREELGQIVGLAPLINTVYKVKEGE